MTLTTASSLLIPAQVSAATLKTYTGSDPAAGVEISETVPVGKAWIPQAITFTLTTDVTAVSRLVSVVIDDGTNIVARSTSNGLQNATQTTGYSFYADAHGSGTQNTPQGPSLPLAVVWMGPGWRIRTIATTFQAGDNYGAPVLSVLEYSI